MKKAFIIIAAVLGGLVLLLVAAAVAIAVFVDPNDYKDQISEAVEKQTGRELQIEGDLALTFFPWLGVETGTVVLGNAAGFGPEPFARVERSVVRVRLLPLLRGEVQVGTVVLHGVQAHLARRADGTTNWDDLVQTQPDEEPDETTEPRALAALAVGGLDLRDGRVVWDDAMEGVRYELSELRLTTGEVVMGRPVPLSASGRVAASEPALDATFFLQGSATLEPDRGRYAAHALALAVEAEGEALPGERFNGRITLDAAVDVEQQTLEVSRLDVDAAGISLAVQARGANIVDAPRFSGSAGARVTDGAQLVRTLGLTEEDLDGNALRGSTLESEFEMDLDAQTASVPRLVLNLAGVRGEGRAHVTQLLEQPNITGELAIAEFAPRAVLERLGVELPEMQDAEALGRAALRLAFSASPAHLDVEGLQASLDDTTLRGEASVRDFEAPVVRFNFAADRIDMDRYLGPETEHAAPSPTGAAAAGATELPLDLLRALDVEGRVTLGEVKVMELRASDLQATLTGRGGELRLHPVNAALYGGRYQGDLRLDVRGEEPRIAVNDRLQDVQIGALLEDFMGDDLVRGTANLAVNVGGVGLEPEAIMQTLTGEARVQVRDGAIKNLNIAGAIREGYARYQGQRLSAEERERSTDFAELSASAQIEAGLVSSQDLQINSPLLRVRGAGTLDLNTEEIDYRLNTIVVATLEGQDAAEAEVLRGLTLPVRVSGTYTDPSVSVELRALLEGRVREEADKLRREAEQRAREELKQREQQIEQELKKREEQVEQELKQREEELKQKLEEGTRDRLRDLLRR
ncbi:AsmA family protein [Ectothiorhodospiraceae bacterium 2226]|nr:AsmA family protein [Ectothiorhodospiraceae bacterium 2226]